jgi:predicted nuclease of predicted toxin-antitoxin system
VLDCGLESAEEEEILAHACSEDRVLLSADTDFAEILAAQRARTPSLSLFRRGMDRQPQRQAGLLLLNLEALEEPLARGSVVIIEQTRIRVRLLPFNNEDEP